jgi:hypothetical protein
LERLRFGVTTLGVTPLGMTPVRDTPLGVTPLGVTPLGVTPLGVTPLGVTLLGVTPLFLKLHILGVQSCNKYTRLFQSKSFTIVKQLGFKVLATIIEKTFQTKLHALFNKCDICLTSVCSYPLCIVYAVC